MSTINDAIVVSGSGLTTAGNGGRKLVWLDNGWIVAGVLTSSTTDQYGYQLYVSKDNGLSFSKFISYYPYAGNTTVNHGLSLVSKGTDVYVLYSLTNGSSTNVVLFKKYDLLIGSSTSNFNVESSNQDAMGACSLAINEAKTELHAAWASINSTYPNSFNIRYAKGSINANGTVTWGAVEQVTKVNTSGRDILNPSIALDKNQIPMLFVETSGFALAEGGTSTLNNRSIAVIKKGAELSTNIGNLDSSYTFKNVSIVATYSQSFPSAIYVPQSINGLANGLVANAWMGKDATSNDEYYINFSKSMDGGITWSTPSKLYLGSYPSITASKNGKLFITYVEDGATKYIESIDNGNSWSTSTRIGTGTYPSSLVDFDININVPLTIRRTVNEVFFSGSWSVETISPPIGERGQILNRQNILTYNITSEEAIGTVTEKINGVVVGTKTLASGQNTTVNITQAQFDSIPYGKYRNSSAARNTITIETSNSKWEYTFDKRLATDADIVSTVKATQDANEVYLPAQINRIADVAKAKGATIPVNPKVDDVIDGINNAPIGRVLSGVVTSASGSSKYEMLGSTSTSALYPVTVSGLTFKPKRIVIKRQNFVIDSRVTEYIYGCMTQFPPEQVFVTPFSAANTSYESCGYKADKSGLSVTTTGFTLPVYLNNTVYEWTAYEK